ncbi:MAG: neuraminidase-like domain-containing protein, partial [Kofleriaceae bacterium]
MSLAQPFTLPLERLSVLLGHFKLTRFEIAKAMQIGASGQARARLGLSLKAYELITTERFAAPYLLALYRIQSTVTAPDVVLAGIELPALVTALDLPHATLEGALKTRFVSADGSTVHAIEIEIGKRDPADVQNNLELVLNLTLRRLDRLHRFLRLWRTLAWTVDELDEVLAALQAPVAAIQGATLEQLVEVLELHPSLPVEERLALRGVFPLRALRDPIPLFDRLFNRPEITARDGRWEPDLAGRFTHPAWTARLIAGQPAMPIGHSVPADNTLARLLGGLQLGDAELVELVAGIGALADLDHRPASATEDESIALTRAAIVVLYRYAKLKALLGCSITELLRFVRLANLPNGSIASVGDLRTVRDLVAWQKSSGFTLDQLEYLTDPRRAGALDPAAVVADVIATIAREHSLEFADTLFTRIELTDAESRELVAANVATAAAPNLPFEASAGAYRVRALGTAGLVIPATLAPRTTVAAVVGGLADLQALHVLDVALVVTLGRALDEVSLLRAIADPLTAADTILITRALQIGTAGTELDRLVLHVTDTLRIEPLLRSPVFDAAGLRFVRDQRALFFGPTTLDTIRHVVAYTKLVAAKDSGFTTASAPADRAAIGRVLVDVAAASDPDVAAALRSDAAQVSALRPNLVLPLGPFAALAVLAEALALAGLLGVSGETLRRMVDESTPATVFDQLAQAAEDVFGAISAKYPGEELRRAKLEPFDDILRSRKRDGLVDYLVTRWPTPFADPNKLYEYFLIDVLVEGCARTSRVVSATGSVQLYVQRVLSNVERSADGTVDARFSDLAKRAEWTWRKHYRVWEANRRVFLYPENYLEPELRDDKTPLFEELEDALLMQEISPQSALDAYTRYLSGFDELTRLSIAGAFYEKEAGKLHLFGVTQDDAPVYYYRELTGVGATTSAAETPTFSAWHKLALQIPVRRVSPVIYAGRLYVFWVETTTRPINKFLGGESIFGGYRHAMRIKFSTLRLDGAWSAPQLVTFVDPQGRGDSKIIDDPLDTERKRKLVAQKTAIESDLNSNTRQTELAKVRTSATDAINAATDAANDRFNAQQAVNAFPTTEEQIAIGAAAVFGGPGAAFSLSESLRIAHVAWLLLKELIERERIDARRNAIELRDRKEREAAVLQTKIDDLAFAIAHLKIYVRWDSGWRDHTEALDSYKPDGWEWERIYPEVVGDALRLTIVPRNAPRPAGATDAETIAYFGKHPRPLELSATEFVPNPGELRDQTNDWTLRDDVRTLNWNNGLLQLVNVTSSLNVRHPGQAFYGATYWLHFPDASASVVGLAPPTSDLQIVNGAPTSVIVENRGDSVWLRSTSASAYGGTRLTTDLVPALAEQLWRGGVGGLLDGDFQGTLTEDYSAISPIVDQAVADRRNPFHPNNPERTYFRETFFHIPFLVANHLNSQNKFADTQQWYHYIFDPTAAQGDPWRYREFRRLPATTTLRDLLTDAKALSEYRAHPFSPHAIARTRMTAYQKSIVMKYIDNLLDWGDTLFGQFTMESINEATMLYVMAQDILGPRPAMLGSCGEGKISPKNYRTIGKGMSEVSDFLVELEAPAKVTRVQVARKSAPRVVETLSQAAPARMALRMSTAAMTAPPPPGFSSPALAGGTPVMVHDREVGAGVSWTTTGGTPLTSPLEPEVSLGSVQGVGLAGSRGTTVMYPATGDTTTLVPFAQLDLEYGKRDLAHPGTGHTTDHEPPPYLHPPLDLVPPKHPVFCIPPNADLLAYWSRVEDRLFKIRHCMDLTGLRRQVDLFAPPIDPRLLVRMTAAGLSIDDVLNSTSGNLPPYRFTYLIEKARQHAGTVQAFGAQLLAAFEKGDAEELAHLRAVHEQNLLQMRTKLSELEITAAEDAVEGLRQQRAAVEYRQ